MKKGHALWLGMMVVGMSKGFVPVFAQQEKAGTLFNESVWRIEHLSHQKGFIKYYQNDEKFTHISFNPYTHKITGSGLCNKFMGSFQNDENQVVINKLETQKNICLDSRVNQQDEQFFNDLKQVRSYSVSGKFLKLLDGKHQIIITAKYFR